MNTADDLPDGSVALLGVPWDENSSFLRGCAAAPARIREALHSPASNTCAENGIDVAADPRFRDLGDLSFGTGGNPGLAVIDTAVSAVLARGGRVLALGGDHAITYPILRALAGHCRPTILHVDAHPDLYDSFDGNRLSHASPFARICEEGLCARLVQVGIRTMNRHQQQQADRFGVEVVTMRDWHPDRAVELDLDGDVYVSIDLDGLDPAFAPGVSHREPGGLTTRDLLRLLDAISGRIVGADVVELNPQRDVDGITAAVAAKLVKELAGHMLGGDRTG